jgi:hypothetical protein
MVPTLKRGETVLMDNLSVHKVAGVAEAIQAAGAMLIYLPSILTTSTQTNRYRRHCCGAQAMSELGEMSATTAAFPVSCHCVSIVWPHPTYRPIRF